MAFYPVSDILGAYEMTRRMAPTFAAAPRAFTALAPFPIRSRNNGLTGTIRQRAIVGAGIRLAALFQTSRQNALGN